MSVKIYDKEQEKWVIFPGTIGAPGKDAYLIAQENGYTGTKSQYNKTLVDIPKVVDFINHADNAPTKNSNNLVLSGGTWQAIENIKNKVNDLEQDITEGGTNTTEIINQIKITEIPNQIQASIVDNLESSATDKSLSANQGRILKEMISNLVSLHLQIVEQLPENGENNVIYLVNINGEEPNIYDEYVYIDNKWEKIGNTDIDLSNYYTKTEVDQKLSNSGAGDVIAESPFTGTDKIIVSNGVGKTVKDSGISISDISGTKNAIQYDITQNLSNSQQEQALSNIGLDTIILTADDVGLSEFTQIPNDMVISEELFNKICNASHILIKDYHRYSMGASEDTIYSIDIIFDKLFCLDSDISTLPQAEETLPSISDQSQISRTAQFCAHINEPTYDSGLLHKYITVNGCNGEYTLSSGDLKLTSHESFVDYNRPQSLQNYQKMVACNNIGAATQEWVKEQGYLTSIPTGTIPMASDTVLGGIKLGHIQNQGIDFPEFSIFGDGTLYIDMLDSNWAATTERLGFIKVGYSAPINVSRNYPVELTDDKKAYVHVPWTNSSYSIATESTAGLVKPISVIEKPALNAITTTSDRYYSVQMSSDGSMFVNVPWVESTNSVPSSYVLPVASRDTLGGIKLGYDNSDTELAVKLSTDNKAYCELTFQAVETALGYIPADETSIPTQLPNPNSLTITANRLVNSYNGSSEVNINFDNIFSKKLHVLTNTEDAGKPGVYFQTDSAEPIVINIRVTKDDPTAIVVVPSSVPVTFEGSKIWRLLDSDSLLTDTGDDCYKCFTIQWIAPADDNNPGLTSDLILVNVAKYKYHA